MNLNDIKGMMKDMGWHVLGPEPQDQKFGKWIKTIPGVNDSLDTTFKTIEASIEQVEKNLDDINERCQKIKGNFPQHYPKAKLTPPKKKVEPMFQEREKSDAGKLADKFTELLKKK